MAKGQARIGEIIGEYRLQRYLGRGSFGTVYLAEYLHDHRPVAMKLLHTSLTNSDDWQHFLNEARSIRLQHPHIMPLLDFGISHEETAFLVMEFAAGGTIKEFCKREGRLPFATIATYTVQLASALQYAHDRRLIHRDVKPENMLLRADGTVLLSDFGIAHILEQTSTLNHSTHAGTPAYMAPEQGEGHPCPASDQYALAVAVYEWMAGRRPFLGTPIEVAIQHRLETPPALRRLNPQVSPQVEQILARALAKTPIERFPTVTHFAQALERAIQEMDEEMTLRRSLSAFPTEFTHESSSSAHPPVPGIAATGGTGQSIEQTPTPETAETGNTTRDLLPDGQTPVLSLVNPLSAAHGPRRSLRHPGRARRHAAIFWRVAAIVLLVALLAVGGTWFLTSGHNPLIPITQPGLTQTSGTSRTTTPTGATATSQAATPAIPQGWHRALNDPLTASNHTSTWEQDATCVFLANAYSFRSTGSNYCSNGNSALPAIVFGDFYLSMDVSIRQGSMAGMIFRNRSNNYYYFAITPTGNYALSFHTSLNGGDDRALTAGTTPAIHQGLQQWNTLVVIARGSSFSLFINNIHVKTVVDSTRAQGLIGIAVNGPAQQSVTTTAWFKNAVVWIP